MYWSRVYTPCASCSYECNSAFGFIPFNSRLLIDCSTARAGSSSQSESFHCRYSCGFVDDVIEVSWLTCTWWQSLRYEQGGAWPQYNQIYQTFELVQYNMWDSGTTQPWYMLLGLMYTSSPLKFKMFSKCYWTQFPTFNSSYHCNVLNYTWPKDKDMTLLFLCKRWILSLMKIWKRFINHISHVL